MEKSKFLKNVMILSVTLLVQNSLLKEVENKGLEMINIGLNEESRKQVAQVLNVLLADEYVLYTKTLKYHWNVVGHDFGPLHAFFKDQYEHLFTIVDDVAERVRAMDFPSYGTLQEFQKNTTLPENPGFNPDDMGMIANLLADHEIIIRSLRINIESTSELGDEGTSNFLTDLMEKHEKMAWMLRAFIQK